MPVTLDFDPTNPLARVRVRSSSGKMETAKANKALNDYYELGAARTLWQLAEHYKAQSVGATGAERPPTKSWNALQHWSNDLAWKARIDCAEHLRDEMMAAARVTAAQRDAEEWIARRKEVQDSDYELALKLRKLALDALDAAPNFIRSRRRVVDGREIVTMAIDITGITRAADLASKLARLSTDQATSRVETDVAIGEDLEKLRERRWREAQAALGEALNEAITGGDADSE